MVPKQVCQLSICNWPKEPAHKKINCMSASDPWQNNKLYLTTSNPPPPNNMHACKQVLHFFAKMQMYPVCKISGSGYIIEGTKYSMVICFDSLSRTNKIPFFYHKTMLPPTLRFSVFTSHVIKTKNRNHSMNKIKNLGYHRWLIY